MKYISTRGNKNKKSFTDILLAGLAPDGGLYMPEEYPFFSKKELDSYRKLSYGRLAFEVFKKFGVDIPDKDLLKICLKSYDVKNFKYARNKNQAKDITPVIKLKEGLYLQELSNGPTLAFKDMAMQVLGNLFEYVLEKKNKKLNILGATSGDTGSAAEYALRGKKRVNVFMMSPHEKMSPFQRAQMYSLEDKNIFNISVRGMFDDAQDVVKKVSMDEKFKSKYPIGAVNSINWARVLAQVVYYVNGYLKATENSEEEVSFCVPTGNFGNICAGLVAKKSGLPIKNLYLATNENDVLDEFFKTGIYRPRGSKETYVTSSPSMDISKASNFERFIFELFNLDGEKVKSLWQKLDKDKFFNISKTKEFKDIFNYGFISLKSSEKDRMKTIKKVKTDFNIFIDTHTADAFKIAFANQNKNEKLIVLETAQAIKFQDFVEKATGMELPKIKDFEELKGKMQKIFICNPDEVIVKEFIKKNS